LINKRQKKLISNLVLCQILIQVASTLSKHPKLNKSKFTPRKLNKKFPS